MSESTVMQDPPNASPPDGGYKRPPPARVEVVSKRAVAIGIVIFALLLVGAVLWKLHPKFDTKEKLKELEFSVEEPVVEEFELEDPMRDILQEQPEDFIEPIEVEERPNIQMTTVPTDLDVVEETVQTRNIEVQVSEIQVEATEIDFDAPEEISEVAETVEFAANVLAVDTLQPAEIFKHEKPNPRDKPLMFLSNRAPAPSRNLEVLPQAFGDQDIPTTGELGPMNVNLLGTGNFMRTMTRFGGVKTRSAVDAALHWLAVHQEADGIWEHAKWEGTKGQEASSTGLALLALMGGGHTPRQGAYRRNVLRGIEALMKLQKSDGNVDLNTYVHSIATIALCEAYGRARDERVGAAARKAVDYLAKGVNPDGGWGYSARSIRSDMSVSGWAIQALKTAKLAQVPFDNSVYSSSLIYVDSVTDRSGGPESNGGVGYTYNPNQRYSASPALTPAGMVVRQFSGVGVKSHILLKGAEHVKKGPPSWRAKNFYRWYYATYAMHNMGGEHRVWWNRRIRDVLIENQSRDGDNAGSWDPVGDSHSGVGGRVYTTALGALCLEVYYRYSEALNSFGIAPDIDDLFLQ